MQARSEVGGSSGGLALNEAVLLRVLAHRAEHAASKYLKAEFNLPKRASSHGELPKPLKWG